MEKGGIDGAKEREREDAAVVVSKQKALFSTQVNTLLSLSAAALNAFKRHCYMRTHT